MNCVRKTLFLLVATLAPLGIPTAEAAGLGEMVILSELGESFRAEVKLIFGPGEKLDASCFKRVNYVSNDDTPWINNARLRLAGDHLIITTREPVNHPFAMLGLHVGCDNELRRDYTILLQPPGRQISPPIAANVAAADYTEQPAAPPARASTRQQRPASRLHTEAAHAPTTRPARPPKQNIHQTGPAEPPRQDRLTLGSGDEVGRVPLRMSLQLANPPRGDEADGSRQQLRQEQRTLAEIDDRIASQLEVNEKIKRLEEYQALLKERVAQLDDKAPASPTAKMAARPGQPSAPAAAPEASTTPSSITEQLRQWGPPIGGLFAVLLGGGALMWLRRRRPTEVIEDLEPTTQPDFRISAPPSTTQHTAIPKTPEEMRAMPPIQQAAPPPPADNSGEWAEPTFAPAHPIPFDETVDEQDSALELAEIMMSFGRTQGAAETLADYIRNNPRQAVKPWLKLLEVYHVAGMRAEFEVLTRQLNKTFNVKMIGWSDFQNIRSTLDTVEQIAHVCQRLQDLWGTPEAQIYIHQILRDNRNGTRQGFPLTVVEELLLLLAILDEELGPCKPTPELTLEEMEPPPARPEPSPLEA